MGKATKTYNNSTKNLKPRTHSNHNQIIETYPGQCTHMLLSDDMEIVLRKDSPRGHTDRWDDRSDQR